MLIWPERDEVIRMLNSGKTPREIKAAMPGLAYHTIISINRRYTKLKFKPGRNGRSEHIAKIAKRVRELLTYGLTYGQISKIFDGRRVAWMVKIPRKPAIRNCEQCGKPGTAHHFHHKTYEHDLDFSVLCSHCHPMLHSYLNGEREFYCACSHPMLTDAERMKLKPCRCCDGSGKEVDQVSVGKEMRALREAKGMKLTRASEKMGISTTYLCDLEFGRRKWSQERINKFKGLFS